MDEGEIFLQKRSMKNCFPAHGTLSAGSFGCWESYDACAVRELRAELGLEVQQSLEQLFKIDACPETGQEFVWVYRSVAEGPFTLQPAEIERGAWFTPQELTRWLKESPGDFAGALPLIWNRLLGDYVPGKH
jgi:isopentenyldiphosphate isomerase